MLVQIFYNQWLYQFKIMEKKEKRAYDTYEEAREHLEHIVSTCHKPWRDKKPSRIYEEKGKWYLTSKAIIIVY